MGIERFSQYFESRMVSRVDKSAKLIIIDGNLYWQRALSIFAHSVVVESEFYTKFFRLLINQLLIKHITKSTSQLERIEIVFDNEKCRNFLKWWKCIQRADAVRNRELNFFCSKERIDFFWCDYLSDYYSSDFGPDLFLSVDKLREVTFIIAADCDTDDYVFSEQAFSHVNTHESNTIVRLVSPSSYDDEPMAVSPIVIFTGDSDFLSLFPSADVAAVMDYEDVCLQNKAISHSVVLCNYALSSSNEELITIRELCHNSVECFKSVKPSWYTEKTLMAISIRCLAMTSKNDYLTTKVFHLNALSAALTQADVFLRCEPLAEREKFRDVYFVCTALVFIGECLRVTAKRINGASSRGRIKFFLQNILRFFVFDFEAEFAAKFDTYNKIAEYVGEQRQSAETLSALTSHLTLTQYEFVGNSQRAESSIVVESFADLFKTLKNRVVIVSDNALREHIQVNFKTHAAKRRVDGVPKKYAISNLVAEWVAKRDEYITYETYRVLTHADNFKTEGQNVYNHICVGNLFCQCAFMCFLGLVRIWFGSEAARVSDSNRYYSLALYIMTSVIYETFVPPFRAYEEGQDNRVYLVTQSSNKRKADEQEIVEEKLAIQNPCSFQKMLAQSKSFAKTIFKKEFPE